jgi:PKD repeat protein
MPNYTQSGIYTVRFIVSDSEFSDFEDVEVTVVDVKKIIPKP